MITFLHSDVSIIVFKWHFKPCHSCGQQKLPSKNHSHPFSQLSLSLSTQSTQLSHTHLVRGRRVQIRVWGAFWRVVTILGAVELGRHFGGVLLICVAVVVVDIWDGVVRARYLWIYVLSKPHPVVLWVILVVLLVQLSGVVLEEIWWWWCGTPTPPPPQTALSSSLHSSVDIMYNALTPLTYNSVLHTFYYMYCIRCMYRTQNSNPPFWVADILLCAVYSSSVCTFWMKNIQSAVRPLVKAYQLLCTMYRIV